MSTTRGIVRTKDISDEIMKQLTMYTDEVVGHVNRKGNRTIRQAVAKLVATSPGDGNYASGWTVKTIRFYKAPWRFTIHNKSHYQIAHLLEKGWTKRNGQRQPPVKVHIKPVEEEVTDAYAKIVEEAIQGA